MKVISKTVSLTRTLVLLFLGSVGTFGFASTVDEVLSVADMTRVNTQRIAVQQAMLALASESTDVDGDGYPEPPAMLTGSGGPTEGGLIPSSSSAPKGDSYGTNLGYCAYDNGSVNTSSGRITGSTSGYSAPVLAVISAGIDNLFDTTCAQVASGLGAQGDDYVLAYSTTQIQQGNSGTLYLGDPVSDISALNSLNPSSLKDGQVRLVKSNNGLYRWNSGTATWASVAGSGLPWQAGNGTTYYSNNPIAIGTSVASNQLTVVDPGTLIPIGVRTQGQFNGMALLNPSSGTDAFIGYDNTNNALTLNAARSGGQIALQINGATAVAVGNNGLLTASGGIATTTLNTSGLATLAALVTSNATVSGGSIDGTPIGMQSPASGAFTDLTVTGNGSFGSLSTSNVTITGGAINGTPIGNITRSTGAFTTLATSGDVNVGGTLTAVVNQVGFSIPSTSSSARWIKLGSFTGNQGGQVLGLNVIAHSGYNASTSQNQETKLFFKTSNGVNHQNGFYGDGSAVIVGGGNPGSPSSFVVVQVNTSQYDVYGYFGSFSEGSHYTVSVSSAGTWSHSGTFASPTGTSITITPSRSLTSDNAPYAWNLNQNLRTTDSPTFAGASFTGLRPVSINSDSGAVTIKGDSGGWSNGTFFQGSAGSFLGGFGALGGGNSLSNFWIGRDYNDTFAEFSSTGTILKGSLTVNGSITATSLSPKGIGADQVMTNRTGISGLYNYRAYSDPNAPTTYFAAVGFGAGGSGSAEIGVNWVNNSGMWYRSLRDCCQNWSGWTRVLDTSMDPYAAALNQHLRTTDSPTFAAISAGTITATSSTYMASLGAMQSSWAGSTLYPTLYSSHADRWVMHLNPHVVYTQPGSNGYSGSMTGATIRFASDPNATSYWDAGVGVNSVGTDTYSIGRAGVSSVAIHNDHSVRFRSSDFQIGGKQVLDTDHAWIQSQRDFVNGTLIQSDIDYSQTNGAPWLLEIEGNSYGALTPFDIKVQGYIYSNTIINVGGISNGKELTGLVAFNYNGKLCFWFPRQSYWQGFNVFLNKSLSGTKINHVTSISDTAKPSGITKEVAITVTQSWTSANLTKVSQLSNDSGYIASGDNYPSDTVRLIKNNAAINNGSYVSGNMELRTLDGSMPVLGFHRSGYTAVSLYHNGNASLRLRDANTGGDYLMWHSGNLSSVSQLSNDAGYLTNSTGFADRGQLGGSVDLNTITSPGYYFQPANVQAASGSNYPVAAAGLLEVFKNGVMVYQYYHQYGQPITYTRGYYNGSWSAWARNLNVKSDPYASRMNQDVRTTDAVTFQDVHVSGWLRNTNAGTGLYNQATARHFYSESTSYWAMNSDNGMVFRVGYNGSIQGYVYYDVGGFGLLNNSGNWAVRANQGSGNAGGSLYGTWDATNLTVGGSQVLYASAHPYAAAMNQYVRTTDSPTFAGGTFNGTVNFSGNVYSTGSMRTTAQGFTVPGTGTTAKWAKLGTFTTSQGGQVLTLRINAHSGYNASSSQNQVTDLFFKTSNGSSASGGFYGDGHAVIVSGGTATAPSQFAIVQNSTAEYVVYAYLGTFTEGSHYTVSLSAGAWTHAGSFAAPSGTSISVVPARALTSDNANYAWALDQHLRTSDAPRFAYLGRNSHASGYLVGSYNSVGANDGKTNPIYTIGSNYMPSDTSLGNMYGIGYSHSNFFGTAAGSTWGMYVAQAGNVGVILGGNGTGWFGANLNVAGTVNAGNMAINGGQVFYYQGFTLDANTMGTNTSGFTYHLNAPYTGPIARFGAGTNYDLQINAPYGGGTAMAFRTRNGDAGAWNPWTYLLTSSNYNTYSPTLTGGGASGTWGIDVTGRAAALSGTPSSPDNSHPGYGAQVFYSWNTGQANSSSSGYANGITIGSNPGNTNYGFQIVQNMWDDNLYFRRYNAGWQGWRRALNNVEDPYAANMNQYVRTTDSPQFAYLARGSHSSGYLVGSYNSVGANDAKTNPIYTIGSAYRPSDTALGNMYGIGYSHSNFFGTKAGTAWGLYVAQAGSIGAIIAGNGNAWFGGNVAVDGTISAGNMTIGGKQVLHASNFNDYSPTLTGGGASGTWAISVTGSAGSVAWSNVTGKPTQLSGITGADSIDANASARLPSGFYQSSAASTANGWPVTTNGWYHLLSVTHSNTANNYAMQLAADFYTQNLYFRSTNGSGSTGWSKVVTSDSNGIATPQVASNGAGCSVIGAIARDSTGNLYVCN